MLTMSGRRSKSFELNEKGRSTLVGRPFVCLKRLLANDPSCSPTELVIWISSAVAKVSGSFRMGLVP